MGELVYEYYSNIEESSVEWLWFPYIPYGKITLIQGDPGEGKSTFVLNLIALLTTGRNLPDGTINSECITVVYQCNEDSPSDTIKPRLIAAGANCSKVAFIVDTDMSLSFDDDRIEEVIIETHARLFVLDPLQSFCKQEGDLHSIGRMRTMLRNLSIVADRHNCAIILVSHMNKKQSGKNLYRGIGSIDIAAIARSVLMIERDIDNPFFRYMFPVKTSLAAEGCAIGFKFDSINGFQWIGKCQHNYGDLNLPDMKETKLDKAIRILKDLLCDGDLPSNKIYEYMGETGISERTVKCAKKMLNVTSYNAGNHWCWSLPDAPKEKTGMGAESNE